MAKQALAHISNASKTGNVHRFVQYTIILNMFKPQFWISGFYNNAFNPAVSVFTKPVIGSSHFTKDMFVDGNAIIFKKDDYIISDYRFGYEYTFIGIAERQSPGRVFTSLTGNKCFGFWRDKMNFAWHDGPVISYTTNAIDNTKIIYTYIVYPNHKHLFNNGAPVIDEAPLIPVVKKTTAWDQLVIGDTMFEEGADFKLYECIGFDRALNQIEVEYIINIIK
jgi:hypothetical protein